MKLPILVFAIAIIILGFYSTPLITFFQRVAAGLI